MHFKSRLPALKNWEIRLSDDQSQVLLAPVLHTDYTVTFKGNDGWCCPKACHIPRPLTVTSGTSVTIPRRKPLWCNHRFIGWNTASDGSGIFLSARRRYRQYQRGSYTLRNMEKMLVLRVKPQTEKPSHERLRRPS